MAFGAIPNDNSTEGCLANSKALVQAMTSANSSIEDRVALVPGGFENFYFLPVEFTYLKDVKLEINSRLVLSNNFTDYSDFTPGNAAIQFSEGRNVTLFGTGTVDGQGFVWWVAQILNGANRPHLVRFHQCLDIIIYGLSFLNSPKFHIKLDDVAHVHIHDISIFVDDRVEEIHEMLRVKRGVNALGGIVSEIPQIWDLNTDGIDPNGKDVLIENIYIQNYDDGVAVKPGSSSDKFNGACSQDMLIRNISTHFTVGMTIGSVPNGTNVPCVRNITFTDVSMYQPLKGIYIKTDPGNTGHAIVDSITYRRFHMEEALWYAIWIGPQQMAEPHGVNDGCSFLYPIDKRCPSQPRVPYSNIYLQDINMVRGLLLPGVLLCNQTTWNDPHSPSCTGFVFENVSNSGEFIIQKDYVCEYVIGTSKNSVPDPGFQKSAR